MEGQMSIFDFLPDPNKKPEPMLAPIQKLEWKKGEPLKADAPYICQHSGHSCNKKNLWEVADSLNDTHCPHVCCRLCSTRGCGARCNGSREPRDAKPVMLKGIADDAYCPECGEALDETKNLDCEFCPECGTPISWIPWHRSNDHYMKEYWENCPYFIASTPFDGKGRGWMTTNVCNLKDDGTLVDNCEWTSCDPTRCPKHLMEIGRL